MDSVVNTVIKWYGVVPNFTRQEFEYFKKDLAIRPWRFFVASSSTQDALFKQIDLLKSASEFSKNINSEGLMQELSTRFLSDGCFAPAAYYYTLTKIFYFTFV